jgi:hypothetical protein
VVHRDTEPRARNYGWHALRTGVPSPLHTDRQERHGRAGRPRCAAPEPGAARNTATGTAGRGRAAEGGRARRDPTCAGAGREPREHEALCLPARRTLGRA